MHRLERVFAIDTDYLRERLHSHLIVVEIERDWTGSIHVMVIL